MAGKRTIVLPPKKGAKKPRTQETWDRDYQLMLDAVGTEHEWGRSAVQKLINDGDGLGMSIEVKES